jgi:hypothetical protein
MFSGIMKMFSGVAKKLLLMVARSLLYITNYSFPKTKLISGFDMIL